MRFLAPVLLAFFLSSPAAAAPVAVADTLGIKVTLYNEPCAFARVVDMKFRATWEEKGAKFEGCFSIRPEAGAVVAYFSDKSIALLPMQVFAPVTAL